MRWKAHISIGSDLPEFRSVETTIEIPDELIREIAEANPEEEVDAELISDALNDTVWLKIRAVREDE